MFVDRTTYPQSENFEMSERETSDDVATFDDEFVDNKSEDKRVCIYKKIIK
jgi:hypothetical protein